MKRFFLLTLLFHTPAFSQIESAPPEGKVLKALPIDFEDARVPSSETTPPDVVSIAPGPDPAEADSPPPLLIPAESATLTIAEPPVFRPDLPVSPLDQKPTGDDAVRLQIFLDQANFGPGIIDGRIGRFSELAVESWNEFHGHPIASWSAVNEAARNAVPNPFATAVVPDSVKNWVNANLSYKKAEQAKAIQMSYRSAGEYMSERYHTDVPYLIALNSKSKIYNLGARDSIIVPNVKAFEIEKLSGVAFKEDEALSQRHAVIDTKLNQVRIYEANLRALVVADPDAPARVANQSLIAAFPITPGKPQFIRYGKWEMKNAVELPVWRYDQQLLDTGKRSNDSMNIPGGPNNPVGVLWCGLSKPGIGMHGTSDPETIGRSRSSGCIRLANWDIVRIPGLLRPGCSVEIR